MSFKKATVAALLAASMTSAPVMAQTAAPVARAAATTESSSELRGGFIIPLIALIAVILGIVALAGGDGDRPHSP